MEAPKCKSCGNRHWERVCPEAKSSLGGGEKSRPTRLVHAGKARSPTALLEQPVQVDGASVALSLSEVKPLQGPTLRKRGRPLAKDKHLSLAVTKPWDAEGMSRATWFSRRNLRGQE